MTELDSPFPLVTGVVRDLTAQGHARVAISRLNDLYLAYCVGTNEDPVSLFKQDVEQYLEANVDIDTMDTYVRCIVHGHPIAKQSLTHAAFRASEST
ncbi:MAG TPA: hypothetical protein VL096_22240 [Pirellulaceae bacterium]|nr:hypothetical protein [Pirellulaceae bacterium]